MQIIIELTYSYVLSPSKYEILFIKYSGYSGLKSAFIDILTKLYYLFIK